MTSGGETATCARDDHGDRAPDRARADADSDADPDSDSDSNPDSNPDQTPTPPPARILTVTTDGNFLGTVTSNPAGISCIASRRQRVCTATVSATAP